jgi:hypothetical protein
MRSLVEAVANVVLLILTPVALVWVQSRLAMAIETLGKLPMEELLAKHPRICLITRGRHLEQLRIPFTEQILKPTARSARPDTDDRLQTFRPA